MAVCNGSLEGHGCHGVISLKHANSEGNLGFSPELLQVGNQAWYQYNES